MKKIVWVKTSFIGFHRWIKATQHRSYLSQMHRHSFGVKVGVFVTDDDREVEFHDLLLNVGKITFDIVADLNIEPDKSCEMMAKFLWLKLRDDHGYTVAEVTVDEDGECGATLINE